MPAASATELLQTTHRTPKTMRASDEEVRMGLLGNGSQHDQPPAFEQEEDDYLVQEKFGSSHGSGGGLSTKDRSAVALLIVLCE